MSERIQPKFKFPSYTHKTYNKKILDIPHQITQRIVLQTGQLSLRTHKQQPINIIILAIIILATIIIKRSERDSSFYVEMKNGIC